MRKALRLATAGHHASPNPMVGCVIVDPYNHVVGQGYHIEPGTMHAEAHALAMAGAKSVGSTAYVTLEPCSHFGRTPPCADALVRAGVKRVVVAMLDPDIRVSGRGVQKLVENNIQVDVGTLEANARQLNRPYIFHRQSGMPWVVVKVASTLDGKIAAASGDSRWITGSITRKWVHRQLRDRSDAIMVGINTVLTDNPSLTTRLSNGKGRDPIRIIVDSHLRTPLTSNVVQQSLIDNKTVIACLPDRAAKRNAEFKDKGVVLLPIEPDNSNRIDMRTLLEILGTTMDVTSVLVEGGAEIIASLMEDGLVNRYISTIGPKLIGGKSAIGPIGGSGLASTMKEAVKVKQWNVRRSAADLVIDALLYEQ